MEAKVLEAISPEVQDLLLLVVLEPGTWTIIASCYEKGGGWGRWWRCGRRWGGGGGGGELNSPSVLHRSPLRSVAAVVVVVMVVVAAAVAAAGVVVVVVVVVVVAAAAAVVVVGVGVVVVGVGVAVAMVLFLLPFLLTAATSSLVTKSCYNSVPLVAATLLLLLLSIL